MNVQEPMRDVRRPIIGGLADIRLWMAVVVGALLTWGLAHTGIDARVNDLARLQNENFSLIWSAFPMFAGMIAPLLVPIVLFLCGKNDQARATFAAFVVALLVVSLLKGFTSRVHPEALEPATSLLRSQAFRFGFLEDGFSSLVEGWPSGHTATNGAVGLTLAGVTHLKWVRIFSLIWVVWVVLATVLGINGDVHWLSDTLVGLLICVAISSTILQTERATGFN